MQEHCCGVDKVFDLREAEKQRKKYLRSGPRSSTAALIEHMRPSVKQGQSLIDIGGGIGVLGVELKASGLSSYTSVDASSGYQKIASELLAKDSNQSMELSFICGDFVEENDKVGIAEHVCLDKVICCYPQMESLLRSAARKSSQQIGLSYPPSGLASKLFRSMANLYFRIRGNPFRTFIHPQKEIHRVLQEEGFVKSYSGIHFPWRVEVWKHL